MQPDRPTRLPPPDRDAERHCRDVAASLVAAMERAGGSLSFGEYMQHALYAPGLGYYAAGARKFGAAGDFVTAPEVSPLFAQVLARQLAPLLRQGEGEILELGAGSGLLALQMLEALAEQDSLPARYRILEVSADLRERQQRLLDDGLPGFASRVEWLDGLPRAFRGVVVANEVADALPVERFAVTESGVEQFRVTQVAGRFAWQRVPAPAWLASAVAAIEDDLGAPLPAGYVSELSPGLAGWLADIAAGLDEALLLLFDYGVSRREYYAPERDGGWLRCHFRHRAHDDPLVYPGIQDLTAWVDFTAAAAAAVDAGLDVAGYVTQAQFLLHGGLLDELARRLPADVAGQSELSRQVKLLTLPGEMGEHFKCLALTRGDIALPDAIRAADRSHAL